MIFRLLLLHLRWFGLFVFVGGLTVLFGHLSDGGVAALDMTRLWSGLMAIVGLCGALAVLVPWAMFMIDPRRTQPLTVDVFAAYWKLV